jgi:hypothetical protein
MSNIGVFESGINTYVIGWVWPYTSRLFIWSSSVEIILVFCWGVSTNLLRVGLVGSMLLLMG